MAGIGCSGKIGNYINCYNFHVVHGRALPTRQGMKMANRGLTVIAAGGDGDGYAIGCGHFIHAMRRNVDITYIVMDNQIYGLTKGQVSPTSGEGFVTKTSPRATSSAPCGRCSWPSPPARLRGVRLLQRHQAAGVADQAGIEHKGFALINMYRRA